MILQPLVENAIRYGIASSREKGWVGIASHKNGGMMELQIRNNIGAGKPAGTGIGLRNTISRLKYLYAHEATFSLAIAKDQTATATLILPALRLEQPWRGDNASHNTVPQAGGSCAY